ncbi:putative pyridoxal phosphate-dependent transferase, small domain-containing protein [Dioscorea sansibarensis]
MESSIRKRIMRFLNIAEDDIAWSAPQTGLVRSSSWLSISPSHTNRRLLTVYDYESEAVNVMIESAQKKGAKIASASFSWPSLKINTRKLKKLVIKKKKMKNGLMVFPLQSRVTGARYPYLWMSLAQQNGWHVVFGQNPSGFAALFIKKTITSVLETQLLVASSLSGPDPSLAHCDQKQKQVEVSEIGETSEIPGSKTREEEDDEEIVELESDDYVQESSVNKTDGNERSPNSEIELRGLDHADSIGLPLITSRLRYIVNWLVNALMKLRHPNSDRGQSLVQIYGPRIKFDRAPAVAFNVFDWKGEKVDPTLVQKLADRSSISLSCGFLQNIWFSDKYEEDKNVLLERRVCEVTITGNKRRETIDLGITVVNASLGFLSNFEDAYRLWAFVAKFLDADFVEKERWRYMALNQKMIEV